MDDSIIGNRAAQAANWNRTSAWQVDRRIARLIAWIRTARQIRRDLAVLRAADDRMLADLGLARGELEHAVRHGRPGRGPDRNVRR